jgi:lysophospholipase L1-like esterase
MPTPLPPLPHLLLASLLTLLPAPLEAATSDTTSGAAPPAGAQPKIDPKWETLALKKRDSVHTTPGGIVCIGSSHMANWKTFQTDLKPLTVFNLGIGGSKMSHAAELFIPLLAVPAKPRAVILYEGSNDLNAGETPENILGNFKILHQRLHQALPETRLYVLGIVPSPGKRFERWNDIQATNALLKAECEAHAWIKFLDTTTPLIGADGQPRPECFIPNDPHMTPKGYESWSSVIVPVVVEAEKGFEPAKAP